MSMISKTAHGFFATIALVGMTTPAMANVVLSPGLGATVQLLGTMVIATTQPVPSQSTCAIVMTGTVTSVGTASTPGVVTFTTGSVTHQSGPVPCSLFSFTYPYVARTYATTLLRVDRFEIITPFGISCAKNNLDINYNSPFATIPAQSLGTCNIAGSFQTMSNQLFIS